MAELKEARRYESYKDFTGDWLSEVPSHWKVHRIKWSVQGCINGLWGSEPNTKNDIVVLRVADFDRESLKLNDGKRTLRSIPESDRSGRLVKNGDLLIEKSGGGDKTLVGCTILFNSDCEAVTSNFVSKMTPRIGFDSRYLNYLFSTLYAQKLNYRSIKQTTGIQNLDSASYLSEKMAFPDELEQRAISDFLDPKTNQIEEVIGLKKEQIELLKERKQIIIQQAVTQGLNPDATMKDSGVDWIGNIPEHWEIRRSKFLFTQRKEKAWKTDVQLSATQAYGVIPQSEYEALSGNTVVKIQFHLDKRKHVEKDDFVISMRSFQGGLERAWSSGCIRSSYVVLRPLQEINPDYYGYLLKLPSYIKALQRTGNFIRDGQDLNFDNFSQVDLFIPPLGEQEAIAKYVKEFMDSSDKGIELLQQQIDKLKEYKATLINSAVTGKIKVPEVA